MKNLIILFIGILCALTVSAQDRTVSHTLRVNHTYFDYTGVAADTVSNNADSLAVAFTLNKEYPVQYYIYLDIDTVSSSSTTIKLQGKVFSDESYTDISSVSFGGTDDTTFVFSFQNEITYAISQATSTDTLINGTNAFNTDGDVTQIAYVDTSTLDSVITRWTTTPALDTSYIINAARTVTQTLTTNVKYFRYLQILLIESGTGKTELQNIKLKIWRREN